MPNIYKPLLLLGMAKRYYASFPPVCFALGTNDCKDLFKFLDNLVCLVMITVQNCWQHSFFFGGGGILNVLHFKNLMCYNRHGFDSRASPTPSAAVELSPGVGCPAAVGEGGGIGKHGGPGQSANTGFPS